MVQLQMLQHQTKRYQHLQLSMHHSHLHHHHRNHNSNQVTEAFLQAHVSHQVTCEQILFHVQVPVTHIRKCDVETNSSLHTLLSTNSLPKSTSHRNTSPLTASEYLCKLQTLPGTDRSTTVGSCRGLFQLLVDGLQGQLGYIP